MRSRYRCSMCPAIHINSRSWLRSSSTHEPSDPPLRVVIFPFADRTRAIDVVQSRRRVRATECGPASTGHGAADTATGIRLSVRCDGTVVVRVTGSTYACGRSPRRFIKPNGMRSFTRAATAPSRQVPVKSSVRRGSYVRAAVARATALWAEGTRTRSPEPRIQATPRRYGRRPRRRACRRSFTSSTAIDA